MWQYPRQVGEVALIDRQKTLRSNSLHQTIKGTSVQVPALVVHSRHHGILQWHQHLVDTHNIIANMRTKRKAYQEDA